MPHNAILQTPAQNCFQQGKQYRKQGNLAGAIACFRETIRLQADFVPAYNNLANALQADGQIEPAIELYQQVLHLAPNMAVLHCNLASLWQLKGETERAIAGYRHAIELNPDFFIAHHNLGKALATNGDFAGALAAYQHALRLQPNAPDIHFECGNLFQRYGFMHEAIDCYKAEIRHQPQSARAYNALGAALQLLGEMKLSEVAYRRAINLQADFDLPYFNLGQLLEATLQLESAQCHYEQALALAPDNLRAAYHLSTLRQKQADWQQFDECIADLTARTAAHLQQDFAEGLPALMTLSLPLSMSLRKAVAQQLARQHAQVAQVARVLLEPFATPTELNPPRLRIGYVSPDFRTHAVGILVCQMFQQHQRPEFEIFAYSLVPMIDECTETIRQGCDHFIDVSYQAPLTIAQRIHADGIHILIDLAGYTAHSCTSLFAFKPAPLQIQFLGYPSTMGADFIPYIIADAQLIPEHLAQHYSEEIIYLPCAWVASPMPIASTSLVRNDCGLPENAIVYCCFNGTYKITPDMFALWMRVLRQVPGSVLWLQDAGEKVNDRLRQHAVAAHVEPERLIFSANLPHAEYLARYRLADLFLDTLTYNAGATAAGALWAGLPVLTCPGESYAARMGASLCHAIGLPELVCNSVTAYEHRAIELGNHPEQIAELKGKLANTLPDSPLFQPKSFVLEFEQALRSLWQKYRQQLAASIDRA